MGWGVKSVKSSVDTNGCGADSCDGNASGDADDLSAKSGASASSAARLSDVRSSESASNVGCCSFEAKLIIALSIALVLIITACIVFVYLTTYDIVNIPGMDPDTLRGVYSGIGCGALMLSGLYLMIVRGLVSGMHGGIDW